MFRARTVVGLSLLAVLLGSARTGAQAPEVISNDSVVQMVAGKVPKDVILAKIHSTSNSFDVSPNGLIGLTKSKLDKDLINAMIAAKTDSKEVLNNDAVITMVTGNVNKDVILFKIHSTKARFDLTSAGLVALAQNKVPQDIQKAMLNVEPAPIEEPPPPPTPAARAGAPATSRGGATPPAGRATGTPAAVDKPAAATDAGQPVTFTATGTMKTVYDKIRTRLTKATDTTIQQADAVLGQITAVRAFKEGTTEHESRIVIKVTSASGNSTVKVSVFDKTRREATPPARWSVEKFEPMLTSELVVDLKTALQAK
jgi:hypothetical protein